MKTPNKKTFLEIKKCYFLILGYDEDRELLRLEGNVSKEVMIVTVLQVKDYVKNLNDILKGLSGESKTES